MAVAVFDTNLLIAWLVFADRRCQPLFDAVAAGSLTVLANWATLAELRRVLAKPHFALCASAQEAALAQWQALTRPVPRPAVCTASLPACADRDDQIFLELARDGGADWLVTRDKALLKLARRIERRGLFRILTPEAALDAAGLQSAS